MLGAIPDNGSARKSKEFTSVRDETIWSLAMETAALASLGGAKRARSEMVDEVGSAMWVRLSWGLVKVVTTVCWEGVGREGLGVSEEAMEVISIGSCYSLSLPYSKFFFPIEFRKWLVEEGGLEWWEMCGQNPWWSHARVFEAAKLSPLHVACTFEENDNTNFGRPFFSFFTFLSDTSVKSPFLFSSDIYYWFRRVLM